MKKSNICKIYDLSSNLVLIDVHHVTESDHGNAKIDHNVLELSNDATVGQIVTMDQTSMTVHQLAVKSLVLLVLLSPSLVKR